MLIIKMSTEELIDKLAVNMDGNNNKREISLYTLSTCMWCKKCKRWLDERNIKYRYVDVDRIDFSDKSQIIDYLKDKYQERISYPFMVCDEVEVVVGYDPNKYEKLNLGGD